MQLVLTWPDTQQTFQLEERFTAENVASFDLEKGEFSPYSQGENNEALFYWGTPEPVIVNRCPDYVCIVNGKSLQPGDIYPLRFGTEIQLGHYKLVVKMQAESLMYDDLMDCLFAGSALQGMTQYELPELEDILSYGGHHVAYMPNWDESYSPVERDDVLKKLELEYKRFLIWGEQNRNLFENQDQQDSKLSSKDDFFDEAREQIKNKTLTECIFESTALIDKVCEELAVYNSYEEFYEDEDYDLLKLLAPENIVTKEKKIVPSLVFQELYKLGLDSHL